MWHPGLSQQGGNASSDQRDLTLTVTYPAVLLLPITSQINSEDFNVRVIAATLNEMDSKQQMNE